jgi:hypothetical protein
LAERGRSSSAQAVRRPFTGAGGAHIARHVPLDAELRRRVEPVTPRKAPPRRVALTRKPVSRASALRTLIEQNLLLISSVVLLGGITGWGLALYGEFRASGLIGPSSNYAETARFDSSIAKGDPFAPSTYAPSAPAPGGETSVAKSNPFAASTYAPSAPTPAPRPVAAAPAVRESAATIIARDWSYFEPKRTADVPREPATPAKARVVAVAPSRAPVRTAAIDPVNTASIEKPAPSIEKPAPQMVLASASNPPPTVPHVPLGNIEAKTSLVDFETAPFPYRGTVPGANRPFLDAGEPGRRGHVNFRGRMFLESKTFGDDRVLLHIPQGFDPNRPAVMVVFFHGHGATLERDVRDRQRLPDQISAAGLNAVLVAPQFAFDAADSSAGKFWDPDGFKHFLDETAKKLATLYGDQRSAAAFANMPIVLVAYSGGFGPTLSVLARGGAQERIRGLVLLDALYAGIDQFADWIADHRSTFFVSSYTPHTAHHNADLEHELNERAVPYSSELRRNHLQGMVTFLPAGDVPHRDFVTHAWTDNPVEDILLRMNDVVPKTDTATHTAGRN